MRRTEDQQLLAESASRVLGAEAGSGRFRSLRDQGRTQDGPLWSKLIELGWPAIPFSEADGGMGWGLFEIAIVMEALGHHQALTPMLSTVLAGTLDPDSGALAGRVVGLAWEEGAGHRGLDPHACEATIRDGRLDGTKVRVLDGMAAEAFVVTAQGHDGLALFRVAAADTEREPLRRMDHRDAATVRFTHAPAERLSASVADLETTLDHAAVALAAEMVGGAQAAMDTTLAYMKERIQFDVPIGSFQVLQHRAVDCTIAIELGRAAVYAAARDPSPTLVSLAKTRCNEAYLAVANEAIQLHGGIGMTDEHDIGFHLKRARVASQTLGTSAYHRDRWARIRGY